MQTAIDFVQLRNYAIFKDLPDEALQELVKHCQYQELSAGETLFEQESAGDKLYLLEDGQIHIIRQYPDGEQVILVTEQPYYIIGELSAVVGYPRTGAVVAVSDCTLFAIDRDVFFEICKTVTDVADKTIEYLAHRLYRLNLKVREYAISNVAARIASVLWLLSNGGSDEITARIRASRVARAIATDADTVQRILNEWRDAGYITYDGRHITILDVEMIRDIAG